MAGSVSRVMRSCQSAIMPAAIVAAPVTTASSLRLAFVGQRTFYEACALGDEHPDFRTTFIEFRGGGDAGRLRDALDDFDPHVAVVFCPEVVPAGTFEGLRLRTLGVVTQPTPSRAGSGLPHGQQR